MTQIAIKGNILQTQMELLLNMLRSWNIPAEVIDNRSSDIELVRRKKAVKRAAGCAKKYANPSLVHLEKDAWANHVAEKYALSL
jgi:phage gp46-like protein